MWKIILSSRNLWKTPKMCNLWEDLCKLVCAAMLLFACKDRLSGHQTVIIQSENLSLTFIYFCLLCVTLIWEAKITSTKASYLIAIFPTNWRMICCKVFKFLLQNQLKYFGNVPPPSDVRAVCYKYCLKKLKWI